MKRLRLSLQLVVALLAIACTLVAKGNVFQKTVLRTTQSCYINPTTATVGSCVSPTLLRDIDMCTEPPLAYCCYTFEVCPSNPTKVLVDEIILYRGD
ncbi:MAG: hypothetical protein JST39_22715 [Bacteroidetes bacterium]|nr:hypothetical protein [Bacteroidota bacterium]